MSKISIPPEILACQLQFLQRGEVGFFRFILGQAIISVSLEQKNFEIYLLELAEKFFALYRRKGDDSDLMIGKIIRRVAHKIYRLFKLPHNPKFLNLVP